MEITIKGHGLDMEVKVENTDPLAAALLRLLADRIDALNADNETPPAPDPAT